jgi:hypothetical protein
MATYAAAQVGIGLGGKNLDEWIYEKNAQSK